MDENRSEKRTFRIPKALKYFFLTLFLLTFTAALLLFLKLKSLTKDLPDVDTIAEYRLTQPSMVYDRNGKVIAELGTERRYPISFDDIPKNIRNAVVSVEDARFYEHSGIDFWGIARAAVKNIRSGRLSEGGSTLTQQLVKNIYLSPEKKFVRKYKEAVLAYRIDKRLSKDQILELYLNLVNFGRGGYGVQSAAINYFGKNAKDMTLVECALLAGIPRAPSLYSPHISKNKERSLSRRNHVLLRMLENGYITEDEYAAAKEEPITITETTPTRTRYAGYFLDFVLKYLTEELKLEDPQNLGLRIYTTLDIEFQTKAEEAVRKNVRSTSMTLGYFGPAGHLSDLQNNVLEEDENGVIASVQATLEDILTAPSYLESLGTKKALVTGVDSKELTIKFLDNSTGAVKLANNRWAKYYEKKGSSSVTLNDFKEILKENDIIYVSPASAAAPKSGEVAEYLLEQDPPLEAGLFAIDPKTGAMLAMVGGFAFEKSMFNRAVQAKRQVGSIFKPLVYSTAIELGQQPLDKVLDAPIVTAPDANGMVWRPKNFEDSYFGLTTLKDGLTRSRNVVTIKVAQIVGIRPILDYAKNFGITSPLQPDYSITIGSGSISLMEMVYAYSVFPNMGTKVSSPYFITKIEDMDGNMLSVFAPPAHVDVIKPSTAQIMTDILINVVQNGTGARAKAISRPIGAKTGTTNENRDAWFIGFLPNFVVGVWTGFDDYGSEINVGTGAQASAPTWVDFVKSVVNKIPMAVFPVAGGVIYKKVDTTTWEPVSDAIFNNTSFEPYRTDREAPPELLNPS